MVAALALLAGCASVEERDASEQADLPAETQPAPEPEALPEANLSNALALLENGREPEAREVLERLSAQAPASDVVTRLIRQIDKPVNELLPEPYRQVEVEAGDSLSLIAAREMGDPLMFYALAGLNGIDVPARVPVGTMLRVPQSVQTGAAQDRVLESASANSTAKVDLVAEYLARIGQVEHARGMLIGKLADGNGAESTQNLLVRVTLERSSQLRANSKFDLATSVINEAMEVITLSRLRSQLINARSVAQSKMFFEAARDLRARGEIEPAYQMAVKAAELDSAAGDELQLVEDLRGELVDSLHSRALVAWRDRKVDQAIRAWESLLAVAPEFEPAGVYLERARRLRERLDQP